MRRHENRTCLDSSQMPPLKRNGMVWWDIRRQVKFLNRHGDSSPCDPWSSPSFVKGSKENFDLESDEESTDENDDEDIGEEREDADEDDKKAIRRVGNGLRENTRKAQKLKHRMQSFKKTRRKRFKTIIVGRSINLWPAKRYKKAEINLLEVIESKGAVFKRPIASHDLRLEARKRIDDACLVDNLRNVSSKLAPGEAERFRRSHNADGQVERWLECADSTPVQVKKQLADTSDSLMKMKQMMRRHENRTCPDSSQMPPLKSNEMVQSGIRHQVKFLSRHEDSRTCDPWSSTRFAKGSKENFDDESDEDDSHDDEEDVGEEREDMGEDDEKAVREVGNGLRENTRTAKKVKHETQSFKKTRRKKFNKIIAGSSINRWAAKMCKKAEINLLEVESKGAVFKSLIPRPSPRLKARKRIDDTCLVDNVRNVSSERFRKPHSADGQGERWLDNDDSTLVQVKKQLADLSDSLVGMKDTLPLSTTKLLKAWRSCGGGPKRRVKSEKAPEGSSKNQSEEMKATQVKDSSIQIGEGIDPDSLLEYDIFKDVRNKRFETPVADQRGHLNCAPVCISQCIGLTYAIRTQSYIPELAAQEPLNWMELHEPSYYVYPDLLDQRFIEDDTKRRSFL